MLEEYVTKWKGEYQAPIIRVSSLCLMPFYVPTAWRLAEPWLRRDAENVACALAPDMIRVPRRLIGLASIALAEGVLAYVGARHIDLGDAFPWMLAATNIFSIIS